MGDQLLSYKEYQGSAEISLDDDCLYGKILLVSDLIIYEAQTVPALRLAFQAAVDNYLEQCAELGMSADTPLSDDKRRVRA